MQICYTSFNSLSNKSARIFLFGQLLYNEVDFTLFNFEAAAGLQIEATGKMKVAAVGYWTIGLSKTSKIIIASFMRNELGIAVFEIKSVKKTT